MTSSTVGVFPTSRTKWQWPFSSNSIWNLPIGSGATYANATLADPTEGFGGDEEYLYKLNSSDPLRSVYGGGAWTGGRCQGTIYQNVKLPIADDLIVPDSAPGNTPNNCAAFLMPDGRTIEQISPLARCMAGGNVHGYRWTQQDIYGTGIKGSHGGSGLSAIGGSLRLGELTSSEPIRHALKLVVYERLNLSYNLTASANDRGFRWPADRADSIASQAYKGTNPEVRMGSLLAIPPSVSQQSLNLQTIPGRKIFSALQDYGAYIVDASGWNFSYFGVERGTSTQLRNAYGYGFFVRPSSTGGAALFYQDLLKLWRSLKVITNNSSTSIGGGGTRRQPLAPAIID